jgi:sugar phosphate isomerase/epimerase
MIRMSPNLSVGGSAEEQAVFLRQVKTLGVNTITMGIPAAWTDDDIESTRGFLDEHGIRVGECHGPYKPLRSINAEEYELAKQRFRQNLRGARILGAHCVSLGIMRGFLSPHVWSEETWEQCITIVKEVVRDAEEIGVDIAAHPHIRTPLCSVERYKALLEAVASPRLKILMDPVNLTWPQMVYKTAELVNHIFDELSEFITAFHAKDVIMTGSGKDIVHIDEAVPGEGTMDYATILRRLDALAHDVTVYVEHFPYPETVAGQQYIRSVAREIGVTLN